ncbi:MAG: DUF1553 domain-containing protein [Patescibacteria group bacterium]|nr:DUF1553 domain-containing protein [Patescibacteria group bacterium]
MCKKILSRALAGILVVSLAELAAPQLAAAEVAAAEVAAAEVAGAQPAGPQIAGPQIAGPRAATTEPMAAGGVLGIFESPVDWQPQGVIDELLLERWRQAGVQPAALCSDGVFVRRVYLDVIGTLPSAEEARAFLLDDEPDKRRKLIDRLLERDEFADYWAMKWSDLLRVKAEFPINLWPNAAQAYHRWIRTSIAENQPYDQFVRELLTANGSNFRVGQVNFYRAVQSRTPEGIAQAVALTFMGTRAERWPEDRLAGMAAFFSKISYKPTGEWKEEIVAFDPSKETAEPTPAVFPDGEAARLAAKQDPRSLFADWLIRPENPWFTRNIANRVWFWLLGRGIIHEPDDLRPDNPPEHPELLAHLEEELVAAKYDLKHLYRLILNSGTYQLSSRSASDRSEAAELFAFYPVRRLEAEVLIDAINQITGMSEQYTSAIPEPFTYIPQGHRSIALPDGSITSPFLEQFGRPPRDTGLEFERSNRPTADQRLHMLNSSHIRGKLENGPKLRALLRGAAADPMPGGGRGRRNRAGGVGGPRQAGGSGRAGGGGQAGGFVPVGDRREILAELYLTIVSRFPTEEESATAMDYVKSAASPREGAIDVSWALINSAEFLYRH